jgi:hypothetical protein
MSIAQHQPDGRMTVFGDQSRNTLVNLYEISIGLVIIFQLG